MPFYQISQTTFGFRAQILCTLTIDQTFSGTRLKKTIQNIDRGRFTTPIFSQQSHDMPFLHRKIQILIDQSGTIVMSQVFTLNHILFHNSFF